MSAGTSARVSVSKLGKALHFLLSTTTNYLINNNISKKKGGFRLGLRAVALKNTPYDYQLVGGFVNCIVYGYQVVSFLISLFAT